MNAEVDDPFGPVFIARNGKEDGPFPAEDVSDMLDDSEIDENVLAWTPGLLEWRAVGEALTWAYLNILKLVPLRSLESVIKKVTATKMTRQQATVAILDLCGSVIEGNRLLLSEPIQQFVDANSALLFRWQQGEEDSVSLDVNPAWEFVDMGQWYPRDWHTSWERAGGRIISGRMVARKDDAVWLALSDFGYPFAPFSFDSMNVIDLGRDEAIELGIFSDDDVVAPYPIPKTFNVVGFCNEKS